MSRDDMREPCLDLFWEQADLESASEHPLERELGHRLDALTRYDGMIATALEAGTESVLQNLQEQRDRQQLAVDVLRRALADALAGRGAGNGR